MKLTTKSRCAIAGMIDLALLSKDSPDRDGARSVTLVEISRRQDISLSYLEQLFQKLRKAGLVTSSRGRHGGYKLSRSPSLISMADIIVASGDTLDTTNCRGKGDCKSGAPCLMHHMWTGLNLTIYEHLRSISIQEVMDMNERAADGEAEARTAKEMADALGKAMCDATGPGRADRSPTDGSSEGEPERAAKESKPPKRFGPPNLAEGLLDLGARGEG